ncbi:nickel pincer cofactor biosynthesis protein LarC [Myxococcota bacterium]|nr:nickel pincer cofactor biosynthesis protein LarC [Myxococcota bacterium]MBU1537779.1 nickel pincer cofactor biosynthesis protein LarC [Myxococcota bacterium]
MRVLYYDCFSGISGDMNLAAMIGLGVEPDFVRSELSHLKLDREFTLTVRTAARKGISGTQVEVVCEKNPAHDHPHRSLSHIRDLISESTLSPAVKKTSLAIFERLARAEGAVHNMPPEEVHFHEVGAVDAIVDIVGAAIACHALGVEAVWCSPIELGGGFVKCAHGILPVPAPATVELLSGIPTTRGAVPFETTTPTGAAILATLVDQFIATPAFKVTRTAYGVGHRDHDIPNVLRVQLVEVTEKPLPIKEACLLQCNIDDMTGELLGVALERLMAEGAMDVHFTPIVMKKGRPATNLSLLCSPHDAARFQRLLFIHTTTNGVKTIPIEKCALTTSFEQLQTPMGPITMKHSWLDGAILRSKPELDEVRAMADREGLPVRKVLDVIERSRSS